jgi:hypothetical protein
MPRWASCLLLGLAVVVIGGIAAGVVVPLLMAGLITSQVGTIIEGVEGTAQPGLATAYALSTQAAETAQVTRTPTPGYAAQELRFGAEGTGPGLFSDTRWAAVAPDGSIYTAEYQDGRVQKFDAQGQFDRLWSAGGDVILQDIAVRRDGVVLVTAGGKILKFSAEGEPLGELVDPEADFFTSLAATADGGLVAVEGGENIVRFGPDEQINLRIPAAISSITGDSELQARVAVDGLGNLYVLGTFNDSVFVFDSQGKYQNRVGAKGSEVDTLNAPNDVAVDGKGRVFVSDIMGIKVFAPDGRFIDVIDIEGAPFGLAFDDQNRLYAVSNAPVVARFVVEP